MKRHGQCMCGAVSFEIERSAVDVGACHCTMCRQWGSGPYMSIHHKGPLTINGEENVTLYKSSDWAHRAFCKNCGTNLFYLYAGKEYFVSAGLFSDADGLRFEEQIFIDEKPDFFDFANDTKKMTAQEVIELYTSGDGTD